MLVVEDNLTNHQGRRRLLSKLGISTHRVENATGSGRSITSGMSPDLILMDIRMPVLDGLKASEVIRQWESDTQQRRLPPSLHSPPGIR